MLDPILIPIINFIENTISSMGPLGVSLLMAIESCNVPLPSEAILPFAGFLVSNGVMTIHEAAWAGAFGCVLGSIPSYYLGYFGGRPFIEKYGKYFLISKHDLEIADKWEKKYGNFAFFICRMLPIVRTFISLPAGILKANIFQFLLFTFLGSLIWSYPLVYVGMKLGEHREKLSHFWHQFDILIVLILAVLFIMYLKHHFKHLNED
ncbi:MAG: alkaline phosphatase [Candidatus Melainabacteria bacterium]|nr:MAG: alkaline phosphatase [Candidatus Melainabacteria bacterium]